MERELKNKLAVITGGAQGIGFSIADQFLGEGATAVILDINEETGENAAKKLKSKYGEEKISFFKCDITTDLETVYKKIKVTFKSVDVLVNNAGIIDEDSIRKTMEINTIAPMEWTMKFREDMRKDKGGKGGTIINISSIYGYRVDPFVVYYKASKFAIYGFSKALGHKLNYDKTGVRILTMCPGFAQSAISERRVVWEEHHEVALTFKHEIKWQSVDDIAVGVVQAFKTGDSGTAWLVEGGEPIESV